eukprot:gene628-224_t
MWGNDSAMGNENPQQQFQNNSQQNRQTSMLLNPSISAQNLLNSNQNGTSGGMSHSSSHPNLNPNAGFAMGGIAPAMHGGIQQFPGQMMMHTPTSFYSGVAPSPMLSQSVQGSLQSVSQPQTPSHNPQASPQATNSSQFQSQEEQQAHHALNVEFAHRSRHISQVHQQQRNNNLGGSCPVTTTPQQGGSMHPQFGSQSFVGGGPQYSAGAVVTSNLVGGVAPFSGDLVNRGPDGLPLAQFGAVQPSTDARASGQGPGTSSAAPSTPVSPRNQPPTDGGFFTQNPAAFAMPASTILHAQSYHQIRNDQQQPAQQQHQPQLSPHSSVGGAQQQQQLPQQAMQDDDGGLAGMMQAGAQLASQPGTPRLEPAQPENSAGATSVSAASASAAPASTSAAARSVSEERKSLEKQFNDYKTDLESRAKNWQKEQEEALEKRLAGVRTEAEKIIQERDGRIAQLEKALEEGSAKAEIVDRLEKENADLRKDLSQQEASVKRANEHIMELNKQLLVSPSMNRRSAAPVVGASGSFDDFSPSAPPAGFDRFGSRISAETSERTAAAAASPSRQANIKPQQPSTPGVSSTSTPQAANATSTSAHSSGFGQQPVDLTSKEPSMSASMPSPIPSQEALSEMQFPETTRSNSNTWSPQEPAPEPGSTAAEPGSGRPSLESSGAKLSRQGELSEDRPSQSLSRRSSGEQSDDSSVEFDCQFLPLTPRSKESADPPIPYVFEIGGGGLPPAPRTPQSNKTNDRNNVAPGKRTANASNHSSGASTYNNPSPSASGYISPRTLSARSFHPSRILPRANFSGASLFNGRVRNDSHARSSESGSTASAAPKASTVLAPQVLGPYQDVDQSRPEIRSGMASFAASVSGADVPIPFSPSINQLPKRESGRLQYPQMGRRDVPLPLPGSATSAKTPPNGPAQLKINGGRLGSPSDSEIERAPPLNAEQTEENFFDAEEESKSAHSRDGSEKRQ